MKKAIVTGLTGLALLLGTGDVSANRKILEDFRVKSDVWISGTIVKEQVRVGEYFNYSMLVDCEDGNRRVYNFYYSLTGSTIDTIYDVGDTVELPGGDDFYDKGVYMRVIGKTKDYNDTKSLRKD